MQMACYYHAMANLQIRNMPGELIERLRILARERKCTMSAAALAAIERDLAAWEWRKRWEQRPPTDLGIDAATLLAEERAARGQERG